VVSRPPAHGNHLTHAHGSPRSRRLTQHRHEIHHQVSPSGLAGQCAAAGRQTAVRPVGLQHGCIGQCAHPVRSRAMPSSPGADRFFLLWRVVPLKSLLCLARQGFWWAAGTCWASRSGKAA
jgi:hypothetical protein